RECPPGLCHPVLVRRLKPVASLYVHGIIDDILRGELRLNLSALTAMTRNEFNTKLNSFVPGPRMFAPYVPSGGQYSQGPTWEALWQFAQVGDRKTPAGYNIQPTTADHVGLFPIIERFQLYVVLRLSGNLNTGSGEKMEYRPRLYLIPAVVLWNP